MKKKPSVLLIVLFVLMAIIALMYLSLFAWSLFCTLYHPVDFANNPASLPQRVTFSNYLLAFQAYSDVVSTPAGDRTVGVLEIIFNTILYAGGCAFLGTAVPCMTAYVVAKYKFRILKIYYIIVIVCMSIPIIGGTASQLLIAKNLLMYNTIWGLWLMRGYFLGSYFLIFYSAFQMVPDSFAEAARIDGAGNFTIMFKLMFPLISKTFSTVMLILFVTYWNEYQTPLIFMPDVPTLTVRLYDFSFNTGDFTNYSTIKLAGGMIIFIPVFIAFIFLQDKLMGNISMGGIKE